MFYLLDIVFYEKVDVFYEHIASTSLYFRCYSLFWLIGQKSAKGPTITVAIPVNVTVEFSPTTDCFDLSHNY